MLMNINPPDEDTKVVPNLRGFSFNGKGRCKHALSEKRGKS